MSSRFNFKEVDLTGTENISVRFSIVGQLEVAIQTKDSRSKILSYENMKTNTKNNMNLPYSLTNFRPLVGNLFKVQYCFRHFLTS